MCGSEVDRAAASDGREVSSAGITSVSPERFCMYGSSDMLHPRNADGSKSCVSEPKFQESSREVDRKGRGFDAVESNDST